MHHQSPTDTALIGTVKAHLGQLSNMAAHDADESTLRVASASLRYLLVEDMLARAWRASRYGGPVTFRTWCIISTSGDDVIAYCGGGELLPGFPISACRNAELAERSLDLTAFRQRPRIQVGAVKVSTVELIQYVANTLGGAHFDPEGRSPKSRKPVFDLLRRLEAGEVNGLNLLVNDRSLLHHEILSVIETLLRSPEVARLRNWNAGSS